jgi:hypothetical protein
MRHHDSRDATAPSVAVRLWDHLDDSIRGARMYEPPADLPVAMQHYLRMWNEPHLDQIRAHLDRAVTDDCRWVDPLNDHTGRDALEANVRGFRTTYPSAELGLGSNVDGHHDRHRYEWVIVVDGDLLLRGFDVMTLDGSGLIERVDGFFGTLDRVGPDAQP